MRHLDVSRSSALRAPRAAKVLISVGAGVVIAVAMFTVVGRPTVTVGAMAPIKSLPTFGDVVRKNHLN